MKRFTFLIRLLFVTCTIIAQTQVIAHRGFWDTTGSAQNSITALRKADSIQCYGSEFDVRMSKDGKLVINHNPIYKGKIIHRTSSRKLNRLKLKNGENLSLLSQYLEAAQNLSIRLILELKNLNDKEKETEAVQEIIKTVKALNLQNRMEYLSFSLHAVKEFIRLAPTGTPVFYLNGDLSPRQLKDLGCAGPDYHMDVYYKHPEWISECKALDMKVNVWTVNKEKDMQWFINRKVDFITTDNPFLLQDITNP
ncbi:MAG: glycerophosphodiester phosphodiesterase [Bacteroides sp.]|nr:glycerophosphodiester phosphodiesterase [Bacteroides sp.]